MFESKLDDLLWIEDLLPPGWEAVPKHGGMAYYLNMKLVLILVERRGIYEHKGVSYPIELWYGCIFPVLQKAQNAFFLKYMFLENHPANKDWLYLPADSEDFESEVKQVMREIVKDNPLLGIPVKAPAAPKEKPSEEVLKKKASRKKVKTAKKLENEFIMKIATKGKKS